jgi:hypothetical protein
MLQIMSTISLMIYFCVSAEDSKALTTSIYGIIDGVKVPFPTETDACKSSIKCPISKGMATTFAMSFFIEPSYSYCSKDLYFFYKMSHTLVSHLWLVEYITFEECSEFLIIYICVKIQSTINLGSLRYNDTIQVHFFDCRPCWCMSL